MTKSRINPAGVSPEPERTVKRRLPGGLKKLTASRQETIYNCLKEALKNPGRYRVSGSTQSEQMELLKNEILETLLDSYRNKGITCDHVGSWLQNSNMLAQILEQVIPSGTPVENALFSSIVTMETDVPPAVSISTSLGSEDSSKTTWKTVHGGRCDSSEQEAIDLAIFDDEVEEIPVRSVFVNNRIFSARRSSDNIESTRPVVGTEVIANSNRLLKTIAEWRKRKCVKKPEMNTVPSCTPMSTVITTTKPDIDARVTTTETRFNQRPITTIPVTEDSQNSWSDCTDGKYPDIRIVIPYASSESSPSSEDEECTMDEIMSPCQLTRQVMEVFPVSLTTMQSPPSDSNVLKGKSHPESAVPSHQQDMESLPVNAVERSQMDMNFHTGINDVLLNLFNTD